MGMRYIKLHFDNIKRLDGYYPAEVLFEYLNNCQSNPYIKKDFGGYFERASSAIEGDILLRRTILEKARKILLDKGWIKCKLSDGQSPTLMFKVVEKLPQNGEKQGTTMSISRV